MLIAPGRIKLHIVLSMFKSFSSRYNGIMPPEKYIVKAIKKLKNLRAKKRLRDSGYAAMVVAARLNTVPTVV